VISPQNATPSGSTAPDIDAASSCRVDRTCGAGGSCGCTGDQPSPEETGTTSPGRRRLAAALIAVACALGCLALPVLAGAAVAAGAALAAGRWVAVAVLIATAVGAIVLVRRRPGRVC